MPQQHDNCKPDPHAVRICKFLAEIREMHAALRTLGERQRCKKQRQIDDLLDRMASEMRCYKVQGRWD